MIFFFGVGGGGGEGGLGRRRWFLFFTQSKMVDPVQYQKYEFDLLCGFS